MTGRSHDLISLASLLTVASLYPPTSLNLTTTVSCFVGGVVGALVPDMDQATNRLWDMLPAGNFIGRILRNLMLSHRTISHSLLGIFIFYKILVFVMPKLFNADYVNITLVIASLMIGYISHIVSDSLTKDGVPLFFPLQYKVGIPPIRALRFTTGKFVESVIIFPATLVYIFYLVYTKKDIFLNLIYLIRN